MITETWALVMRDLKRWYRSPMQMVMSFMTPFIWLILFGQAFNIDRLVPPGAGLSGIQDMFGGAPDYFSFMAIGQLALIILFTSFFGGASLLWDRKFGFLAKLQVAPIPRFIIPVSRVASSVIRSLFQAIIVFIIAISFLFVPGLTGLTVGAGFGVVDLSGVVLILILLSAGFSAIYVTLGLMIENQDSLFALINLVNLPMMFTSSAIIPIAMMPDWLASVAKYNPVTFAVDAIRQLIFQTSQGSVHSVGADLLGLFIFSGSMILLGSLATKRALLRK